MSIDAGMKEIRSYMSIDRERKDFERLTYFFYRYDYFAQIRHVAQPHKSTRIRRLGG